MPPVDLLCHYLSEQKRREFVDGMAEVKVKCEEVIMRQNDKGNNFYLIKAGTCDVWVADASGERKNTRTLTAGSWCGELSLLTGKPRSASIMATSAEVTLLMYNRRKFNADIGDAMVRKRATLMPFLTSLSILSSIKDDYEMAMLADAALTQTYESGETIHESGKPSDNKFYVVKEGRVVTAGLTPVTYGRLQFFGQVELLQNSKNNETRRAEGTTTCIVFRKEDFMKLVPLHAFVRDAQQQQFALATGAGAGKAMRGRRFGESAEASTATQAGAGAAGRVGSVAMGKGGGKKSAEAVDRIMKAVKSNIIFSRLNDLQLTMLQQAMGEHHVAAGQNVITQGEKGNHFFIVESGELGVYVTGDEEGAEAKRVKGFGPGDSFGELALMYNCPRTATISATTDTVLWSLDRVSFRMIVLEANTKKVRGRTRGRQGVSSGPMGGVYSWQHTAGSRPHAMASLICLTLTTPPCDLPRACHRLPSHLPAIASYPALLLTARGTLRRTPIRSRYPPHPPSPPSPPMPSADAPPPSTATPVPPPRLACTSLSSRRWRCSRRSTRTSAIAWWMPSRRSRAPPPRRS